MRVSRTTSLLGLLSAVPLVLGAYVDRDFEERSASCTDGTTGDYDYIIVGAGAGGGPLAARLALAHYKVLLIDAGHDMVNYNTTIPLYLANSNEDSKISLDYEVDLYAPGEPAVKQWYPRASGLGGCTIHNALLNIDQSASSFNAIAKLTNDSKWGYANMKNYFVKIENNIYLDPTVGAPLGHGYEGWLSVDGPPQNLFSEPRFYDPQLLDLFGGTLNKTNAFPAGDINSRDANYVSGGGPISITKKPDHTRSTVRDHLASTIASHPTKLNFLGNSMVTKILTCSKSNGGLRAYGIEYTPGAALLPGAGLFKGKARTALAKKQFTAKYEVIISTGAYQTPQLLMLSGIGDKKQLKAHGIKPVLDLPGVGKNLQDRIEIVVNWELKQPHVFWKNCTFGDNPATDPCLADWLGPSNKTGFYSSGPGILANITKSEPDLDHNDQWIMWSPSFFRGYYPGFAKDVAKYDNIWTSLLLKGHTSSKGWVKLTGSNPQDKLEINKNLYTTPAGKKDAVALRELIKTARSVMESSPGMLAHVAEEIYPGKDIQTDEQLDDLVRADAWGHHACCTAKIGKATDPDAVVDGNLKVRGIDRLRIVDNSIWPDIPGLFVATPIYMMSERASDIVLNYAKTKGWKHS